jgi:glycerophosphoryl diester phosphodiesterase
MATGIDRVELDLTLGADGRLIVASDSWLERADPGHAGRAPSTLAEVVKLADRSGSDRLGYALLARLDPADPAPQAGPGEFARSLAGETSRLGIADRTIVLSFDWRVLQALRDQKPVLRTGCLTVEQDWRDNLERGRPGASPWTAGLDRDAFEDVPALVQAAGCSLWLPWIQDLHALSLAEAHAQGLEVIPWLVDGWETMAALLTAGVDGMITAHPDRLRQVMTEQGMTPPAAP